MKHSKFHLWLIRFIGWFVPQRLRSDWRQEWQAELQWREQQLAEWDNLNFKHKCELLWHSAGAFFDALWLQPKRWEDDMIQDVRYGIRMLRKHPGFSVVVVLTLALGIGANAALFSVINGVLLNALPFPQPEQLVSLHQSKPNFSTGAIPYLNFRDWQKENQSFTAMAISRRSSFNLLGANEAEQVDGRWVTADYFTVLGVQPALGRNFTAKDDERGAAPVVLMSANLWQRKFGAAPDAVGKSLTLDDKSYTIIGVLPANPALSRDLDVYVPIEQWATPALQNRQAALGLHGIGRLKPGVTRAQAQADLDGVMRRLAEAYPDANRGHGAVVLPLKERMVGEVGVTLWLLFGAVGFVLLIACVNVGNLLLARATSRAREYAIRAALGAGRWRLLRQSLTESTLLACLGGGLGLLVAAVGTRAVLSMLPTALPRAEEIRLDGRVLLFTLGLSLLTGVLAGLIPALKIAPHRLAAALKEGGRGVHSSHGRAQGTLVAVEMALALVLLIGAGLMIRSLLALWQIDPGFRAENVLTFGMSLPPSMFTDNPETARVAMRELSDKLNAVPGVRAASFSAGAAPLQGGDDLFFWLDSQPKPATTSEMNGAIVYRVEPTYLTAMSITLLQGRFFTAQDDERSQGVVVIDESLARQYFPQTNPLGQRIHIPGNDAPFQIIGVVRHVKQYSLATDGQRLQAQLYLSLRQANGMVPRVSVVLRMDEAAARSGAISFDTIRRVVQSHHPQIVLFGAQTMNEILANSLAAERFAMILLNAFAAVALLLASIGLYGVISYLVGQRTQELGIRLALGAARRDILRLVLGQGMKMALSGVALGLVAAFGLTRLLTQMLYGVSVTDPTTFAIVALLLTTVALLACFVPARRATKVDPLVALRHD